MMHTRVPARSLMGTCGLAATVHGHHVPCHSRPSTQHLAAQQAGASVNSSSSSSSSNNNTSSKAYDVIVVGLGAFGAATCFHLARGGARVLGLEQFGHAGHPFGSSHGHTRITRLAYREGMEYLPLLRRSWRLVEELQQECGQQLLLRTGLLEAARSTSATSFASAQQYGLQPEVLTASDVRRRFPGCQMPDDFLGVYQADAGILAAEPIWQAYCDGAQAAGAQLRWGTRVASWRATGNTGVEVRTADGQVFAAQQLVVSAGPWMMDLIPQTKGLLTAVRQVMAWFEVSDPQLFTPDKFPVFILDIAPEKPHVDSEERAAISPTAAASGGPDNELPSNTLGERGHQQLSSCWYGFPQWGPQPGFKVGLFNHLNEHIHPDTMNRGFNSADEHMLRQAVDRFFPAASGRMLSAQTCIFTNASDGHFLVDRLPHSPQVMLCSACSGHGFKMSPGVGQLIAQDVLSWRGGTTPRATAGAGELDELALARFNTARPGHAEFLKACEQR